MSTIIDFLTSIALTITFGIKELAVMLISCIPLIELRGAIPVGVRLGLSHNTSFWLAFAGSSLVCIPLLLILKVIFKWARQGRGIGRFVNRVESVFKSKAKKVTDTQKQTKTTTLKKCLGVFIFAALPIPGTGVWTSSAVATVLNLKFVSAVICITLGNLLAGGIILLLTVLLGSYLDYFLLGLLVCALILLVLFLYKVTKSPRTVEGSHSIGN
jgi:uncharacterized membrane protein